MGSAVHVGFTGTTILYYDLELQQKQNWDEPPHSDSIRGRTWVHVAKGGAATTNDADLAKKIRMLRDHGQSQKYFHEMEGFNGRLDAIQAGILQIKLRHLANWNENRRAAASRYRDLFIEADAGDLPPSEPDWATAVYHLYVIRVQDRTGLMQHLAQANIGTGIHYPVPLHLQNAYKSLGYKKGAFPVSESVAAEIVSLPMFPTLAADQQQRIVRELVSLVSVSEPQLTAEA